MRIQFEDWNRGGPLFDLPEDMIDSLDDLAENPIRPWVDGAGLDAGSNGPLLLTSAEAVREFLKGGMNSNLNCMRILGKRGGAIFIRIPVELQRPIPPGCECRWCKAHPKLEPMWDTLAVPIDPTHDDWTYTVHMPDPRDAQEA
jgi:hypothetical protein